MRGARPRSPYATRTHASLSDGLPSSAPRADPAGTRKQRHGPLTCNAAVQQAGLHRFKLVRWRTTWS
jgi:hypothetical protein